MLVSLKLLKKFVNLPKDINAKELGLKLTMSTVEVEEVIEQSQQMDKMVVAEIKEIVDHPNASKLKVCQVNYGQDSAVQVVCGASNIYPGMKSILALPGSKVRWHGAGDLVTLEAANLRGVDSFGMLCAPEEIGLPKDFQEVDGIVDLKIGKAGQAAAEVLGLDDVVIDIDNKSLTNRPDLWGHYGLAREVAALYKQKLIPLENLAVVPEEQRKFNVEIINPELCYRYTAVVIDKVKCQPSPDWVQRYLRSCGLRPINLIVDLTNYVMLELGQPLHAFDAEKVDLASLKVKLATSEEFVSLDDQKRMLDSQSLMIADKHNNLAMAGIIGGKSSAISESTTTIVLESANFADYNIRKTSNRLGLRTDASIRFEKSLDPELTKTALERFVNLLKEIDDQIEVVSEVVDIDQKRYKSVVLELDLDFLNKRLGIALPKKQVIKILNSLEFKVEDKKKSLLVTVPSFRATKDISIVEDLVEEVARIYGYDNIQPSSPQVDLKAASNSSEIELLYDLKKLLVYGASSTEVYNYSFAPEVAIKKLNLPIQDHLAIKNSLSEDQRYLRLTLLEGLYKTALDNSRFFEDFSIFEVGRVYSSASGDWPIDNTNSQFLPAQPVKIAGLIYGDQTENIILKAKGLVEMLLASYSINGQFVLPNIVIKYFKPNSWLKLTVAGQDLGLVGEVNSNNDFPSKKSLAYWELDFAVWQKFSKTIKRYQPLAKYPSIIVDLAVVVSEKISWGDVESKIVDLSPLVKKVELFDIFRADTLGTDKKSFAFHITVQASDRTLRQAEADEVREKAAEALIKSFSAQVR